MAYFLFVLFYLVFVMLSLDIDIIFVLLINDVNIACYYEFDCLVQIDGINFNSFVWQI